MRLRYPHEEPKQPALLGMTPVKTGLVLALINVVVISMGVGLTSGMGFSLGSGLELATLVFAFSVVPAVAVGALLGLLGGATRKWPVWARVSLLVLPAILLLILLASTFGLLELVAVTSIPTLVGVLILEKTTRYRGDPPVPVARVESVGQLGR